jgi:hypothetical protein
MQLYHDMPLSKLCDIEERFSPLKPFLNDITLRDMYDGKYNYEDELVDIVPHPCLYF